MASRSLDWLRRHVNLAAAALYALLALALVSPGLVPDHTLSASDYLWSSAPWQADVPDGVRGLGSNVEQADAVAQFQPFLQYTREALPSVPLWNPHIMAGRPFVGNAQSAVFSPFSVLAYLLPFWWSLALIAAAKVFVAAFGTFLLGRALRMSVGGALLAGVVFGFGLYTVKYLPWPHANVWVWLPWVLLATHRLVHRPGPLPAAGLAAVVGVQFVGGHPESSFHVLFVALCFFVGLLFVTPAEGARWPGVARRTGYFAGGLLGGGALAGVAIAPFLELLAHSADVSLRTTAGPGVTDRRYLASLALYDYWGRPTQVEFALQHGRNLYAGALPLVLGVVGLVLRPARERIAVAVFAAFALLLVFGAFPVYDVVSELPGFRVSQNAPMSFAFVMAVALLAGWGLSELSGAVPPPGRRRLALGLAAALLAVPPIAMAIGGTLSLDAIGEAVRWAWGLQAPGGTLFAVAAAYRQAALVLWLTAGALGLALVAFRARGALGAGAFAALAVSLVVVDLFRADVGQNPAIPTAHAKQPTTAALRYLQSRRPARFAGLAPADPGEVSPVNTDTAMRYDLYDARGYDYPVQSRYSRLWRRYVFPPGFTPPTTLARTSPTSLRALRLLGVSDLLQSPRDPPLAVRGLRLAYSGRDARVYALDGALPRAVVVGSQWKVDSETAALRAVGQPGFDPATTVVTERRLAGISQRPARAPAGDARIEHYGRERVRIRARADRPAVLVLSDVEFPGWKAEVDGRDVPLERVDYLLRGVVLEPGSHRVEMRYRPASWRIGWILTLIGLIGLVAVMAKHALTVRRSRA